MSQAFQPGSSRGGTPHRPGPIRLTFPGLDIVKQYGWRGAMALVAAAVVSFTPLAVLIGFTFFFWQSLLPRSPQRPTVVKEGRFEQDQDKEEAGETALLQIRCEVPSIGGRRLLHSDADPVRSRGPVLFDSYYVRRELVFLRPAGNEKVPFGLLGRPPISVWLPAGDYEVLVVYEAPSSYPLLSAREFCHAENRRKTVCTVFLPHCDRGGVEPLGVLSAAGEPTRDQPGEPELKRFAEGIEKMTSIGTPGGYLLAFPEPVVRHAEEHRGCGVDFDALQVQPREWSRDQIAALRNWLPASAVAARGRLTQLVDALGWREFLAGWYMFAISGVAGLVFTRYGALAMLESYRARTTLWEGVKLCVSIFLISMVVGFMLMVLFDGGGCRGPLPIRLH